MTSLNNQDFPSGRDPSVKKLLDEKHMSRCWHFQAKIQVELKQLDWMLVGPAGTGHTDIGRG